MYETEYCQDEIAQLSTIANATPAMAAALWQGRAGLVADEPPATFDSADIDGAKAELAGLLGLDATDMSAAVLALSGGERDDASTAGALLALSQMSAGAVQGLLISLAAPGLSAAERRALARRGHALADGSYPVPDRAHLHSAAVLAASGHGDVAAARKLIRKRAAELGVDVKTLPGFGDDDQDLKEDAERERGRRKARHRGQGPPNGPRGGTDGSDSFGSGGDAGGPSGGDGGAAMTVVLSRSESAADRELRDMFGDQAPAIRRQLDQAQAANDDDPSADHQAKIDEYLRMLGNTGFVAGKITRQPGGVRNTERPYGSVQTYGPPSTAARRAGERRELAGGRAQSWER